ncbi:hypothetical protein [Phenylobacterium sp.]|uniref:hypothetical protein n=1 Tax=Phenylobacterium sp. TaxID=1871053 RepID=UPI0012046B63|nr:hypothetical protein [Phenylobacterium sp.]THD60408.1 MAG: hypothetical protein E8A49_13255 [Phenylobacterium sp.]
MSETSRPDTGRPVETATAARQGRFGRPVFWVLVFSTLLAAIGLLLAWTWRAPSLARDDSKIGDTRAASAPGYAAPEPAPIAAPPPK